MSITANIRHCGGFRYTIRGLEVDYIEDASPQFKKRWLNERVFLNLPNAFHNSQSVGIWIVRNDKLDVFSLG
jgi:hypothetical protein